MNVITSVVCVLSSFLAYPDPLPGTVIVKLPDGKAAVGASVWVYPEPRYKAKPADEPPVLKTDANGSVVALKEKDFNSMMRVYAEDASGRMGMAWMNSILEPNDKSKETVFTLVDKKQKQGQLIGPDGKPIAGAKITPTQYHEDMRLSQDQRRVHTQIYPPPWAQKSLTATTDSEGKFTLPMLVGYSIVFELEAPGFATMTWTTDFDPELKIKLDQPGTVILKGPKEAKGQDVTLTSEDQSERVGRSAYLWKRFNATFDDKGLATFQNIMPMKYKASYDSNSAIPLVFQKLDPINIQPGKSIELDVKTSPAAKVSGRIVAGDTGKGLADVKVTFYVTPANSQDPQYSFHVQTDKDGNCFTYGPAGNYQIHITESPNGYSVPMVGRNNYLVPPAKVEIGQTHTFAPVTFQTTVSFHAKIVDDKGKPVPNAILYSGSNFNLRKPKDSISDENGHASISNLPADDSIDPRVRRGKAVNVPETFVLEKTTDRVNIVISESNAGSLKGRIIDAYGKPIPNATVQLYRNVVGVGRNVNSGTSAMIETIKSDAKGEYLFQGLWPKDRYWLSVMAEGYLEFREDWNQARYSEAGKVITIADSILKKNNLSVSGVVLGPDGRPIEGVELFSNDGPKQFKTNSLADGSFKLVGFDDHVGFLFAKKDGYRFESFVVNPRLSERVNVKLSIDDGKPVPFAGLSKEHLASQEQLLKTNLLKLWENRGEISSGPSAIQKMSKLDPAIAQLWVDEEKVRSGGKNDYSGFIKRAKFERMLDEADRFDADDIIAGLSPQNFNQNYQDCIRLAKHFISTDKMKALRFVEEAVINARKRDIYSKVFSLAVAGDLAVQAGADNGKKLITEATELAEKLDVDENGPKALAIGYAAAYLAPHDAKKAEALLARLTLNSDYNRYLGLMAKVVSRNDLPRAIKLLEGMKPDNTYMPHIARMMIASEIAKSKPDEAVKIVESIQDVPHRVRAMAQLALLFAKSDQKRSIQLVDQAFAVIEKDPNRFFSWAGYGGAVSFAAMIAVTAKEVGHPDVTSLITRTLAIPRQDHAFNTLPDRERSTIIIATSIARIDPVTARKIILTIATPEEFVTRAPSQTRDWLFALALADPELAKTLLPKIYEKIKSNRNGSSRWTSFGLLEMNSILSTPGQYQDLKYFGSFINPLDGLD